MAKRESVKYVCNNCGSSFGSWSGKCSVCGEWNTLEQQLDTTLIAGTISKGKLLKPMKINETASSEGKRLSTKIHEVDEVLGGGVVRGSINLLAGQPGIGKSTVLLQIANNLSIDNKILYISGEESSHQVSMRANRLSTINPSLELVSSTSTDNIAATINSGDYDLVIVDSIQAVTCEAITTSAGSISQITNSTQLITSAAKKSDTAVILVGHVTKEGSIAGPKVLEHAVDVVLQIEGDRYGGFKLLRAVKNRYGSTSEVGIFEMTEKGMKAVDNPSAALLSERQVSDGSIVLATLEGTRPLLVEVQALVNKSNYGYPKRAASGFDLNRLNLLIAMLEKRTNLNLYEQDIYINIVGGIQIRDPAADLAVCLAIGSAAKGFQLKKNAVVFGEVGLSGEVRRVIHMDKRVAEAKKLGFDGSIGPKQNNDSKKISGFYAVPDVRTALNSFLEKD